MDNSHVKVNPRLFGMTDDLTQGELVSLLDHVMKQYKVSYRVLKTWRKEHNLPVDRED